MTHAQWTAVDSYMTGNLHSPDETLEAVLRASDAAGLPSIHVAPNQGKFLMLLAMSLRAQHILEVGTLGGYSTIWLARALAEGGRVVTLEVNPHHAEVAIQNITQAGVLDKVQVRVGAALESLAQLSAEKHPPFDLIFIDADKENNAHYFEWALKLSRVGTLIVVDNVVRSGAVVDADSADSRVQGVRRFVERVAAEPRVLATAVQTVGSKGYDGFAMILVTGSGERQNG